MIGNLELGGQNPPICRSNVIGRVQSIKQLLEKEEAGQDERLVDGAGAGRDPAEAKKLIIDEYQKKTNDSKNRKIGGMGAKSFYGKGGSKEAKTTFGATDGLSLRGITLEARNPKEKTKAGLANAKVI